MNSYPVTAIKYGTSVCESQLKLVILCLTFLNYRLWLQSILEVRPTSLLLVLTLEVSIVSIERACGINSHSCLFVANLGSTTSISGTV